MQALICGTDRVGVVHVIKRCLTKTSRSLTTNLYQKLTRGPARAAFLRHYFFPCDGYEFNCGPHFLLDQHTRTFLHTMLGALYATNDEHQPYHGLVK